MFLLAAIGAILTSILTLGNVQFFSRSHRYFVDFQNVEALPPKAAVKVAGVEIGKVRKVELVNGRARVTIDINPDVPVYADAVARVDSTGIIGTKFIDLNPGTQGQPELPHKSAIRGVEGASLNQMIAKLGSLFEEDEKHGDAVGNFKETMANIRNISRALNQAMGQHGTEMEEIVMNVRDLTASIKAFSADLEDISGDKKEDIKVMIEKFRGVGEKLDILLAKVNRGEGAIGALLNDKETEKDVKETVSSAKKLLGGFTRMNVYWNYRYRYDSVDDEGRNDLSLKLVPRPGKFYAFGATNINTKDVNDEEHTLFERQNRISAVIGSDFGPFTGYVGALYSRGGGGINFRPFFMYPKLNRRIELNAELSDPKRDRMVQGRHLDTPLVNAGAHVAITNWLWVGARAQDIYERASFQTYMNIIFRDADIASLFGLASVAR